MCSRECSSNSFNDAISTILTLHNILALYQSMISSWWLAYKVCSICWFLYRYDTNTSTLKLKSSHLVYLVELLFLWGLRKMFGKLPLTSYSEYKTLIFVGSESIKRKVFGKQLYIYIYIYFKTG